LATDDDCPVVFVPVVESCPGRTVLPTAFDNAEIGVETETGNDGSGSDAGPGAVGVADPVACATADATAFWTARTVVCALIGDDAAPAGVTPATPPATNISPHVTIPMDVLRFGRKVLLLLCGGHRPALKPAPSPIPDETRKPRRPRECAQQL
jgi:hypothetical protein